MTQIIFYIKIAFVFFLLVSCEGERNSANIFIKRDVRSEYEFTKQAELRANLGDVIISQLEYKGQIATFDQDLNYDSGPGQNMRGIDYAYLYLPEDVTVYFRLDPSHDIEIKLTDRQQTQSFLILNRAKTEQSVKLQAGDYVFVIENNETYTIGEVGLLPVFIQPDAQRYDGGEYKSDLYRPEDRFILIAAKSCVECNFSKREDQSPDNALDSLFLADCDLRDANFRGRTVNSSTFSNSKIGAYEVDPSGKLSLGNSSLLKARFENCVMNNVSFYDIQDLSLATFFRTELNGADFSRSKGEEVLFDYCDMKSSRLDSVSLIKSKFIGVHMDSSSVTDSDFRESKFQFSFMRNCDFEKTSFYKASFQNTSLNYSSFIGTVFCQVENPLELLLKDIISDESTQCLSELTGES